MTKKYIFRYRKCSQYVFKALFNNELTFTSLYLFNDPMEGYIRFDKEKVYSELIKKKYFIKEFAKAESEAITFGKTINNCSKQSIQIAMAEAVDSKNKQKVMNYIANQVKDLTKELKNDFFIASFCEVGAHPVMWSHYSDDSTGFIEVYDKQKLYNEYRSVINSEFYFLSSYQKSIFEKHDVTYIQPLDCSEYVIKLLSKSYKRTAFSINKFIKAVENKEDADCLIFLLTNKMKEWEYEKEIRFIYPRQIINRKRLLREQIHAQTKPYYNLKVGQPAEIYAGEKILPNNLAALAYYCEHKKLKLMCQYCDESIIEKHSMKMRRYSFEQLIK